MKKLLSIMVFGFGLLSSHYIKPAAAKPTACEIAAKITLPANELGALATYAAQYVQGEDLLKFASEHQHALIEQFASEQSAVEEEAAQGEKFVKFVVKNEPKLIVRYALEQPEIAEKMIQAARAKKDTKAVMNLLKMGVNLKPPFAAK